MRHRTHIFLYVGILLLFGLCSISHAFTLLTKDQALKSIFGKKSEIAVETRQLEGSIRKKVLEQLDGKLVYMQQGSESEAVESTDTIDFYFALKNGKKYGLAIIDIQPGKWGPVEFIVAMDLKGVVRSVKVMSYQEQRGRPIAHASFLRQYKGKSKKDSLELGKDIIGVSGATISSWCATFTVKKAVVLYEAFYLNK